MRKACEKPRAEVKRTVSIARLAVFFKRSRNMEFIINVHVSLSARVLDKKEWPNEKTSGPHIIIKNKVKKALKLKD